MSQTEVQLIKDAVIVNADVSNSAAIDVSKISGVMPLAGGTFTNDVTFDGATAGRDIVFDRSDNALEFLDNAKLILGSNADCQILHDGTDTFIQNKVGDLKIANNVAGDVGGDITIQAMNGEDSIKCIHDASVELYENGTKVAETTALGWNVEGVTFSNGLDMDDDHKILLGTGDDLEIYHESSSNNSFIKNGTGNFEILTDEFRVRNNSASKAFIQSSNNGEIQLFFNGSKKFETTNTGIKVTGIPESREDSTTTDFSNLSLPAASSGLYAQNISATTGNFSAFTGVAGNANAVSQSGSFIVKSHATQYSPEIYITQRDGGNSQRTSLKITNPGAVELNYAGTKKFETSSNGVRIPDDIYLGLGNSDDLNIRFLNGTGAFIQSGANNMYIRSNLIELGDNSGHKYIKCIDAGAVELYHGVDSKKLETTSTGVTVTGTVTATSFSGSGANLTDVDAGATGGGSDKIFYENGQTVTTNYTIGDTFGAACNAMAAGPITINSGVTVTVNSGETLTII